MKQRARSMQGGDDMVAYAMGKKADDGDHSEIQLHRIKPQEHFIEAQVQEGDTLQAIALRFYCSISELKRINHIHKDNEIFARRTIKVPVTPYSVLTELIPTQPSDPAPTASNTTSHTGIQELLNTNHFNGLINQNNVSINAPPKEDLQCSIDCNSVVMNSTLAPSVVPYTDSEQNEQATEDTQLLPSKEKISVEAVVVKELTSHGADFGLKWFHLVCCMLILGVVIPLVYGSTLGWSGRRSGPRRSSSRERDREAARDPPRDSRRRTRRDDTRRPRDYRFSNDFSPREREHTSPFDNDFQDTPTPTGKKRAPYSNLDGTRFAFEPEDATASPVSVSSARARDSEQSATRFRFDSDSISPRSMFEDDFAAAPRPRTASIAEEEEGDLPPLRPRPPPSNNRDIRKSDSINIFTRESDPFEGDAFFACTGSDRAARRENWPGDFQGFDNA